MTGWRVEATGHDDYISEDRPALYFGAGDGNIPGVQEVFLIHLDPEDDNETLLGWFPVEAIRDALNALDITPTRRINS